jgi:hydroxymethylpyrimidine kinase/phosphomethylpyrimidine kinase
MSSTSSRLWLVGGLDPTGGAGILRDAWSVDGFGREGGPRVEVFCVVTAFTEQGDGRPARAHPIDSGRLVSLFGGAPSPAAIKLGLVPEALVDTVSSVLAAHAVPVVVDPVLWASDGGSLSSTPEGIRTLASRSTLVTPNRPEAAALTRLSPWDEGLAEAFSAVCRAPAVLLKDGHGSDPERVVDILWDHGKCHRIERPRLPGPRVRGTGCALASAISCALAAGMALEGAVRQATKWLDRARARAVPGADGRLHLPAE